MILNKLDITASAKLLNVSVDTIKLFSECGLLKTDENKLFDYQELTRVFGKSKEKIEEASPDLSNPKENIISGPILTETDEIKSDVQFSAVNISPELSPLEREIKTEKVILANDESSIKTKNEQISVIGLNINPIENLERLILEHPIENPAVELSIVNELTKSLRDQIETLRDERDWLRTRVEQMEERSKREQMLLLTESDTVRRLISKDKLGWIKNLPWFNHRE